MILSLLRWLGSKRPYWNILGNDGSLYMGRWWLLGGSNVTRDDHEDEARRSEPWPWPRGWLDAQIGRLFCVRLHHIAREDRARDLHNHPAPFVSIIVKGWYIERLPEDQNQDPRFDMFRYFDTKRTPGSFARRRANDRHTITKVSPGGAWTIFIMGPKDGKGWGFFTGAGFVNWRRYGSRP